MSVRANVYFAGAGLVEIGLRSVGIEVQQSFEIDPVCCATQRLNFAHEVIEGDLRTRLAHDEKDCDAALFTFPCNRYSGIAAIHGNLTGDELFLHAFRRMAIRRYPVYAVENVPGMKKFPVVMEAMTQLPGYHVQVFSPVRTALWLPQHRDRLIVLASRRRFAFRPPEASGRRVCLAEILDRDPEVTVPDYALRRLRGGYRDRPIISDPARDDLAPTCVAHYAKDRSTRMVADRRFKYGARPYTVREYARLQGVPDNFGFAGTESDAFRQIGNGVSIPVAQWIGREIQRFFKS